MIISKMTLYTSNIYLYIHYIIIYIIIQLTVKIRVFCIDLFISMHINFFIWIISIEVLNMCVFFIIISEFFIILRIQLKQIRSKIVNGGFMYQIDIYEIGNSELSYLFLFRRDGIIFIIIEISVVLNWVSYYEK